ncbi:and nb-arc domain containing protein [Sporothrix brasiliensis 5110]|uniref:Riboflavin kinase n=1 Tax=Sporothrix brasiliensis 5110 TaxID=1398154 RepID=A0A0C2ITN9_9PEZI|nr:and nb-arc domain containing protein [Sporothrix brasiliensis 5110]KIH92456.1 and nb-arc domain containing protein [Sporothrix brasiliensis 5110]
MDPPKQPPQAIQRKPLQRKPLPNLPPQHHDERQLPPTPTSAGPLPPPTGPPPAYEVYPGQGLSLARSASPANVAALTPRLNQLQLNDAAAGPNSYDIRVAISRQGTASTTTASTATSASSPANPPLPRRPGAGQFAPGITASPGQLTPASTMSTTTTTISPTDDHSPAASSTPQKEGSSIWKTAFDETRFFAGGLLAKPYESTKHYTVVRHSAGLVMYRGPTTNVVVTVFSTPDHPIVPAQRTVWLQRRGYSGDTGLRLKTLVGASGSWLDVTPERAALASALPTADERGYQRDIAKIMKKTSGKHMEKALAKRQPRETLVVRIPAACADGYFRLVVCSGGRSADASTSSSSSTPSPSPPSDTGKRKVLCGSPVFRVASTSTDASIFRGASLTTLPMEAGVKIASMISTNYVSNVAAPIVSTVQDKVSKYQPGTVSTLAAQTAYDNSALSTKVDEAGQAYGQRREAAYQAYAFDKDTLLPPDGEGDGKDDDDDAPPQVIGPDSGPQPPFPLVFQGRVVRGTGRSAAERGVPTANLADVPDEVRLRLRGVYFGWAAVVRGSNGSHGSKATADDGRLPSDWIEAVVTVAPSPWRQGAASASAPASTTTTSLSVVARNDVVVHLLYDLAGASLVDAKAQLKVLLLGFLRASSLVGDPTADPDPAADAALVVSSLSRAAWGAAATLDRVASDRKGRSLSDKYADTRGKVQKHVDRIPLHWAGVRTEAGEMRDHLYGNGGFYITR